MVKLAIIPTDLTTRKHGFEEVLDACAMEGIRHVELASYNGMSLIDLDEGALGDLKDTLDARNMAVASLQTQLFKTIPANGPLIAKIAGRVISKFYGALGNGNMHGSGDFNFSRIDDAIDIAKELGTKTLVSYSYMTIFCRNEEDYWNQLISRYREFGKRLEAAGLATAIECEGDTLVRSTETYQKLLSKVNSAALGINLDLANFIVSEGTFDESDYHALNKAIISVHLKDLKAKPGKILKILPDTPAVFGSGNVPWNKVLSWMQDSGYNGIFSIEPHFSGNSRFEKGMECVRAVRAKLEEFGFI
ncbi:TIM barrel protein [Candidatus Bathyarchaeota archaeon]|nr:TIM barrel protein [Candidatus Bathyarchaeota archaeon]